MKRLYDRPSRLPARIRTHHLLLIRSGWLLVTLLAITHVSASFPLLRQIAIQLCPTNTCVVFSTEHIAQDFFVIYLGILIGIFTLSCLGLSAFLIWRAAREPMALYTAFMLVTFGGTTFSKTDSFLSSPLWASCIAVLACCGQILFLLFFYLFPDGHFTPRWTRIVAPFIAFLIAIYYSLLYVPSILHIHTAYLNIPGWLNISIMLLASILFATILFAQVYRYRVVSKQAQRRQTQLVVFALSLLVVVYLLFTGTRPLLVPYFPSPFFFDLASYTLITLCLTFIPIAISISILRERLWEMSPVVKRALVYGALTACIISIYVLIVGLLASFFQAINNLLISALATGCIALLVQPLRTLLQRSVNRLIYGERDEPTAVLTRLGQRLEATLAPQSMAHIIVETVAQALKLPYAELLMKHGAAFDRLAAYGKEDPTIHLLTLPLGTQYEQVGELRLAPRGYTETFTPSDLRLLREFAYQAGLALRTVQLNIDLQHSREQLVLAREEERRRIRRDLHDGLAPTLAALALGASTLGDLIPVQPEAAVTMAHELETELRATIGDIRRLVYDLRPPALDQLGLVAALREYINQHTDTREEQRLQVTLLAPEPLAALPAALEVAAYRIGQEAFMNVLRHAQARHCRIQFTRSDVLQIEITDDGIGIPDTHRIGVGLLSMQERAAELGGTCTIERRTEGGTAILARLPLLKED